MLLLALGINLTFITRVGFSTSTLAYMLDSLVRVSRRVGKNHFGKIAQSFLRPHAHRHMQADYRSSPVWQAFVDARPHFASRRRLSHHFPRWTSEPLTVLSTRNALGNEHSCSCRRINFYRFLLNDFKSFDSLFKVLFIFPSQYLFAIGFP